MQDLINALISLDQEVKEKIPNINRGGCGYYAYYLAKELIRRDIYSFEFFVIMPLWTKKGFRGCKHIWIELELNDGVTQQHFYLNPPEAMSKDDKIYAIPFFMFIDALKSSIRGKNNFAWNKEYNKSNNTLLKKTVQKWLKL